MKFGESTSETGLCDGSDKWGGKEPERMDLGTLSLVLSSFLDLTLGLGEGISFISQSVAASFLAETGAWRDLLAVCDGGYLGEANARSGDLELMSFHVGTGVLDPPLFPTRIVLLKR